MSNYLISMPANTFSMPRQFKAIANGRIHIGLPDTDPVNPANQIPVYIVNEDGSEVQVSQPIIINAGGFPVYNGQIAKFITKQNYSMAVLGSNNAQQFYWPDLSNVDPATVNSKIEELRADLADPSRGDAMIALQQPFTGSVARTQHEFNAQFISILDAGAVGDGVADDSAALNKLLDAPGKVGGWARVWFPAGRTYFISSSIVIPSKTQFYIERGAVIKLSGSTAARFFNGVPGNATYANGYDGNGDIHFFGGGVIDCNGGSGAVGFAHALDISFKEITFQSAKNTHFVEINSSRNVTFESCVFQNMENTDDGLYEMLQFDYANAAGFPAFGAYDSTPCENVIVNGCVFRNGSQGVGSHANPDVAAHKNIRIMNNGFYNLTISSIRAQGWAYGSVVADNYIYEGGRTPFLAVGSCSEMEVSNNIVNGGGADDAGAFWFSISGAVYPTRLNVFGNRAYKCKGEGFYLSGMTFSNVHENEVYQAGRRGFMLHAGASSNNVRNNRVFSCGLLAADTYDAYYISNAACNSNKLDNNVARRYGITPTYRYAVSIQAGGSNSSNNRINGNDFEAGTAGLIVDGGTLTEIDGATFLTDTLTVTTGTITLKDAITNYQEVDVATGAAGAGYSTFTARGWTSGFRPGTDYVNGRSINGNCIMAITNSMTLTVTGTAPDAIRFIIGRRRA